LRSLPCCFFLGSAPRRGALAGPERTFAALPQSRSSPADSGLNVQKVLPRCTMPAYCQAIVCWHSACLFGCGVISVLTGSALTASSSCKPLLGRVNAPNTAHDPACPAGFAACITLDGTMRRLGLLFVFIGFVWLASLQLISYMRVLARPIADAANAEIAQMSVVTQESAQGLVGRAIASSFDEQPLFILPGLFMLVGGVLIASAEQRAQAKKGVAELTEANGRLTDDSL